jgi:hypothetical protein
MPLCSALQQSQSAQAKQQKRCWLRNWLPGDSVFIVQAINRPANDVSVNINSKSVGHDEVGWQELI